MKTYDIRFSHPSSHLITGPSGSGKTFRTYAILKDRHLLFKGGENIKHAIMCYAQWQPIYDKMKEEGIVTEFVSKLPSADEFEQMVSKYAHDGGCIVCIDDFMGQIGPGLDEIVRVVARHNNASILILFQSLFPIHPLARSISQNIKYFHIHKQPRQSQQVSTLAYQIDPTIAKAIIQIFRQKTQKSYSCLLLDLTQECPDHLRIRINYLPSEYPPLACIPKAYSIQ